jgi:hypothetical protein
VHLSIRFFPSLTAPGCCWVRWRCSRGSVRLILSILRSTAALLDMVETILWLGSPIYVALACFGVYSYMGFPLTADVAFTALALFNQLRFPIGAPALF